MLQRLDHVITNTLFSLHDSIIHEDVRDVLALIHFLVMESSGQIKIKYFAKSVFLY